MKASGAPKSTKSKNVTAAIAGLSACATHAVPGASVTLSPSSTQPGFLLVVNLLNVPGFAPVSSLIIGGVGAFPLPAPLTQEDGSFTASFVLLQAPLGAETLRFTVGNGSAVTTVAVTKPLITPPTLTPKPPPVNPTAALQPVLETQSLTIVWSFYNATKQWSLFDLGPDLAEFNSISEMVSGRIYWFKVSENQTVALYSNLKWKIQNTRQRLDSFVMISSGLQSPSNGV